MANNFSSKQNGGGFGPNDAAESSYQNEYEEVQCIGRGNFGKKLVLMTGFI
jgi:hypothetical protein